ncbi:hypothetical protein O181_014653 [Austropuccinia psidii MF-1]|uniref:Uncharacterized protein n=1 Tax=Austropuccinia psidii MF-1 TaxID=1389203 RepID=A0A9Q3GP82_9BASI|nr:hypothetical protein [Austropuccinia psidii MF-1]
MSPVHLRDLGIPRKKPEERVGMFRYRRSGFGQHGECQDTQGDHSHTPMKLPIKQRPQNRVVDRNGSSISATTTPQRSVPMENGKQEVQPGFKLGIT